MGGLPPNQLIFKTISSFLLFIFFIFIFFIFVFALCSFLSLLDVIFHISRAVEPISKSVKADWRGEFFVH